MNRKRSLTIKEKNKLLAAEGKRLRCFGMTFRILPTPEQIAQINQTLGCHRLIFNSYLASRIEDYQTNQTTLSVAAFKKDRLNALKDEKPYLKAVDKFSLETACEQVQAAYDRFFAKRGGFPKFKKKHSSKQTYTTKYTNGNIAVTPEAIKLPKLGLVALFPKKTNRKRLQSLFDGTLKIQTATITRTATGYSVSLSVQEVVAIPQPVDLAADYRCVGIDLGLKTFAVVYDGKDFADYSHGAYIKQAEKKLAKLQQQLARCQKGSKNYDKQRTKVAKRHEHIANQRKDFHHKLSTTIANENQVVVVEDLNIRGMVKNHKLAKAISNAGWRQFITFLAYKLDWRGGRLVKVNRFFASSRLCSACGHQYVELTLDERHWACSHCGTVHDRDHNASVNIRNEGLRLLAV